MNEVDIVKLLLEKGKASPVDVCKNSRTSPLHIAAEFGHLECVKLLLSNGSPDRPKDKSMNTPYDLAVEKNQTSVVNFLSECSRWHWQSFAGLEFHTLVFVVDSYEVSIPPLIRKSDWFHEHTTRQVSSCLLLASPQQLALPIGVIPPCSS